MCSLDFFSHDEFFQRIKDAIRAWVDCNRGEVAPENHAVAIDNEQGAIADAFSIAVGAVSSCYGAFGLEVGDQLEMQPAIPRESLMAPRPID